jgi:hypothetical protein
MVAYSTQERDEPRDDTKPRSGISAWSRVPFSAPSPREIHAVTKMAGDLEQLVRTDDSAGHLVLERQTGVQVVDVDRTAATAR